MPTGSCRRQAGYSYLLLLFAIAAAGLLLAATGQSWQTAAVREKEAELLFVGGEIRRAIAGYRGRTSAREGGPAGVPGDGEWPRGLEDLLADRRCAPHPCRHLRRIYRDPMTGSADWGLVKRADRIVGVYSLAAGAPLKRSGFAAADARFAEATGYADWKFVDPLAGEAPQPGAAGPAAPAGGRLTFPQRR